MFPTRLYSPFAASVLVCAILLEVILPAALLGQEEQREVPQVGSHSSALHAVDEFQAARALESSLVKSIAQAESSVVAIARGRNGLKRELRDPDFVPFEYSAGVVVDARGLILTNYHSLGDVEKNDYVVWLKGRPYMDVTVRAADPWSDLAILVIDARDLTPIELGDGSDLQKGRIVISLGNPHAIARDGNVSAAWGIVSNLSRKIDGPLQGVTGPDTVHPSNRETRYHFGGLIQTDVRLARGTSGGPLLDLEGRMVGLSTNIAMLAGFEKGAGYAIPVDDYFRRVLEKLKRGEPVEQGFLGVAPRNPFIEDGEIGVVLADVKQGTPAAQAGMYSYDEILQIDDLPVHSVDELFLQIGSLPPDHVARFKVRRSSRELTIPVRLSKKPSNASRPAIVTADGRSWRGLVVDFATAMSTLRISSLDPDGCVIATQVEQNSPAWHAGLRVGAIINRVNGQSVRSPDEFHAVVTAEDGSLLSGDVSIGIYQQRVVIVSE